MESLYSIVLPFVFVVYMLCLLYVIVHCLVHVKTILESPRTGADRLHIRPYDTTAVLVLIRQCHLLSTAILR